MYKLHSKAPNLGRVFKSRSSCMCAMHLFWYKAKQPNLKLKTWTKQLLCFLQLAFVLPALGQEWAVSSLLLFLFYARDHRLVPLIVIERKK